MENSRLAIHDRTNMKIGFTCGAFDLLHGGHIVMFKEAKENYLDIILSNNDFYAISALNIVLEKDLVKDKDKILEYFKKLENADLSEELNDLLIFKKALYLLKLEDNDLAKKLLTGLIDKNSKFKKVAQELVSN